jgi:hypothetical protein
MVRGNAKMSCALFKHRQNGGKHAAHRANFLSARVSGRGHGKKVPEQFVCAVDQINIHEEAMLHDPARAVGQCDIGSKATNWPATMAYVRYFVFDC